MLRSLGDYARLMIFPANLHMERTVVSPAAFFNEKARWQAIDLEYLSIAGLLTLGAFCFGALRQGNGHRLRIFGVAWFFLAYLPISNLVELNATVAEHWLYLPSVGFLIFASGCVLALPLRAPGAGACARPTAPSASRSRRSRTRRAAGRTGTCSRSSACAAPRRRRASRRSRGAAAFPPTAIPRRTRPCRRRRASGCRRGSARPCASRCG